MTYDAGNQIPDLRHVPQHGGYQSSRHDIVSKQTFIIDNVHQNRT